MTLLTVVVPVHKVQGYLRECLDSILRHRPDGTRPDDTRADGTRADDLPADDVEVVAVDDCSPDGSGDILAEYAAHDARLRVLSLPVNVGLGHARNAGLARATGEYVWFVDSDDWLTEGAVPAVLDRLRAVDPDVLLFPHHKVYWDGRVVPGNRPAGFADVADAGSARQTPWVLWMPHVAWNKVVRRRLLLERGLTFGAGWYEDASFTYPVLAAAERISVLDRTCVNYRQRRVGAITRTRDDRHFDVFAHWARAFALLDSLGAGDLRTAVFARMIWHYLVVLGNDDRLSGRSRRAFFARAAADYARLRPVAGYPVSGADRLKHRLLAWNAWPVFAALRVAVRVWRRARALARSGPAAAGRAVRRAAAALRRGSLAPLGRLYYRLAVRLPLDPSLAVFAAYWYRGYACNPAAVYEAARDLVPGVRGVWLVHRGAVDRMPPGVPYVVAGTPAAYRALARATYLVNNVNFPDVVVKRRGSVHVQTHHGAPVKVMGVEQARYPGGARTDFAAMLRRCDRWDYSVTSNGLSSEAWDRAYPCVYENLEYGYPRNDRLVRAGAPEVAAARAALGVAPDERVLLYVPTHRAHEPAYRPPFEPAALAEALGPRGVVLTRDHYFNADEAGGADETGGAGAVPAAGGEGRVRDVTAHPRVEDLYLAADVLVSDYSSAIFDYGVLDRPIVIYAPDWAAYRAGRGVTFDLLAFPPGAVAETFEDLLSVVRRRAYADAAATAARAAFRRRFCAWDDGHAAERVVRRVFLGEPVPGRREEPAVRTQLSGSARADVSSPSTAAGSSES